MRSDGVRSLTSLVVASALSLTLLATGGRTLYTARPTASSPARAAEQPTGTTSAAAKARAAGGDAASTHSAVDLHPDALQLLGEYVGLDVSPQGLREIAEEKMRELLGADASIDSQPAKADSDASAMAAQFGTRWPLEPLLEGVSRDRLGSLIAAVRTVPGTPHSAADARAFLHEYFWAITSRCAYRKSSAPSA